MTCANKVINHSQCGVDDGFAVDLTDQIPVLRRGALWLTHHEADAEDLVQETVTRAWECRAQFRPGSSMRSWLVTIQRSLFISACRRRRHVAWLGSLEEEDEEVLYGRGGAQPAASAEETVLGNWVDEDLRAALAALPDHFREAVMLRDVAQRSYADIAADLACPVGTVMSRLHRGRTLLRQMLEQGRPQARTQQDRGTAAQPCIGARSEPSYTQKAA